VSDRVAQHEPWDSPTNRDLLKMMPAVFKSPRGDAPEGYTYYRAFAGKSAAIPPPEPPADLLNRMSYTMVNGHKFLPRRGRGWGGVNDGIALSLFLAEAAEPVPWTKPDELEYAADQPLPKLGGLYPGGFHVLSYRGMVAFVPDGTPEATVRALITVNACDTVTDTGIIDQLFPDRDVQRPRHEEQ
jgi:hypothetical protein